MSIHYRPAAMFAGYAELHCLSHFSFQRGASSPAELVRRAQALGYAALAITDECSLAGIVRAWEAAREAGLKLIVGSEFQLDDGLKLVLLVESQPGYTALCQLITTGRRRSVKGEYRLDRSDLAGLGEGLLWLWLPRRALPDATLREQGLWLAERAPGRVWLAVELLREADDAHWLARSAALARQLGLPRVAAGDVHMHERRRRVLQDTLTAIRLGCTLAEAGWALMPNGERHLRRPAELTGLYPPELLRETLEIAERCHFRLEQLGYVYPRELVPQGLAASDWLRRLTVEGLARRWPEGVPPGVAAQIEHELKLIAELGYESFFLTVHDIVRYARSRGILCQGRGSAANSAVCYALGITEVDPSRSNLLFERFLSRERNEPPDIDVDFEHERREEVIQYVYTKYGRQRAALAATVICYRPRSAVRDVGKALGLDPDQIAQITASLSGWDGDGVLEERMRERGFDPDAPLLRRLLYLVRELIGFPRHLSQHVGGFVISEHPLHTLVPVENAAMPERTIIQWDKDDLEALGLLKVDCLALGMLSAIRRCLDLIGDWQRRHPRSDAPVPTALADIPAEDPATYAMIQRADTIGVFQIESRAQMAMLPRLKPACFYDLVIEVAIVRPGPIQGRMVHPYLRRRQGLEPVSYPSEALREVFERTLGVPIFQEQVMKLAIVAAGFSPGEADQLRRSMAAWKRRGGLEHYRRRIIAGMAERGYDSAFAEQIFEQIKGFGSYGFPESHAASFALLVYASAWLKCHHPAAFCCALLNSLPMGFYSADQLIQDARRHGIAVLPIDVRHSDWDSTLEPAPGRKLSAEPAIRLGFNRIKGIGQACAERISAARNTSAFTDVQDLARRAALDRFEQGRLAEAGALRGLAGHRHRARWAVEGIETPLPLLDDAAPNERQVALPLPSRSEDLLADYATLGLTLGPHPLALLRPRLKALGLRCAREARALPHASPCRAAGLVTVRQRPGSAAGVTFLTLEDETGMLNIVVWKDLAQRQRRVLHESQLLRVDGLLQSVDGVQHLVAQRLENLDALLGGLKTQSRDFC